MAKTNRPRRRMDRYFKNLQRNAYMLSYNKKGSCTTKIKKWDVVKKLTKKLVSEDDQTTKISKESKSLEPGVQLLPRQDVMLYGTIPALEQRVYSKCKNCTRVFNPRDILTHRSCSKSHTPYSSLLKKKVKSKSSNNKKSNSNGSPSSNSTNSNSTIVTANMEDLTQDFEFKRPFTPPPVKAVTTAAAPSMPQLKVSVTKIGISKVAKSTSVTSPTNTSTSTTSSDKSDSKVSSSKVTSSVHHNPKSPSSGHHSSKSSSGHNPRSPSSSSSSSGHHGPKSPSSSHHNPKSPSSSSGHHRSKSPSSVHYSPRSPSKSGSSSHHGSSHHSTSTSHHSSKSSSSKSTPMDTIPPSSSSSHHHHSSSSSHSSSRHKKSSSGSKRSSSNSSSSSSNSSGSSSNSSSAKVLPKNYDPDIHCGVIEGTRGPCMRSITCSNHRLHLRKQVSGRSKDIHQLIAERKASKENDLKHTAPPCSYTAPNGEAKDILSQNTSYVPVVGQTVSTRLVSTSTDSPVTNSFVPIMPRIASQQQPRLTTTSVLTKKSSSVVEGENESAKTLTNGYLCRAKNIENTQDNTVGTVPVVIMPASPVSVVSSVQLLKIGNNIISLESPQSATNPLQKKQVILPIPSNHTNGVRMYRSHPKPIVLPNFGARKLGGAILLANPLLEEQRNDLLTTIDLKLETVSIERGLSGLNHTNSPHRPNILKGKGVVKTNCKRPASDKLPIGESKRLVPDVNGFILHADVSETADAPQYSGENSPSQHELIISLIDKYGF